MRRLAALFAVVAVSFTLAAALDPFDGDLSAYTKAGTGTWYLDNGRLAHTYSDSTVTGTATTTSGSRPSAG